MKVPVYVMLLIIVKLNGLYDILCAFAIISTKKYIFRQTASMCLYSWTTEFYITKVYGLLDYDLWMYKGDEH